MELGTDRTRIGYFGREGSNTQNAARKMFGQNCIYESFPSIQNIFRAVEEESIGHGVVPIENSVEGTVGLKHIENKEHCKNNGKVGA